VPGAKCRPVAAQRIGKRKRAETEGVKTWLDPEGYRSWVAGKKRAFEDQVDKEMGVSDQTAK
jgi:metallo-beta-lactamase class B